MKVFINGIDSGTTVSSAGYSSGAVTLSSAITVPSDAKVTFYAGDNSFTRPGSTALTSATSFTATVLAGTTYSSSAYSNVVVGDKLFNGTVDTGVTVTSMSESGSTYTFNLSSAVSMLSTETAITFKHPLAMTLATPVSYTHLTLPTNREV